MAGLNRNKYGNPYIEFMAIKKGNPLLGKALANTAAKPDHAAFNDEVIILKAGLRRVIGIVTLNDEQF